MEIALIGAGRVGIAVISKLKRYKIAGVWDIDKKAEKRCYRILGKRYKPLSLKELVEKAKVILIATPDKEIEEVYKKIESLLKRDKTLIHFSGALSSNIFKKRGIGRASMHPVQTFPSLKSSIIEPGLYFAIEGNPKGIKIAKGLVTTMRGKYIALSPSSKPLYHTMCVVASNFLVGILDFAVELGKVIKLRPEYTIEILSPLIEQTLKNIKKSGSIKALSGPIERGDIETIEKHIISLKKYAPKFTDLYISISSYLLFIARRKGNISKSEEKKFLKILKNLTSKEKQV